MTLYTHTESNIRKTWFLIFVFLVLIIGVGWIFSAAYNSPGILFFAIIVSVVMSISSYWFSDKIVLAMSHAKEVKKQESPELYRLVENVCIAAGLPLPRVYVINEGQPNAFATGRNPKHSVVAFTTGLLGKLEKSELEGVVAHELAHIKNRDALLQTVVVVLVGVIALASDWFLRISFWGGGRRGRSGSRGNTHPAMMLFGIIAAILVPVIATLIRLAISRKREFLADASGALMTRHPEGLARALEKISSDPSPIQSAKNATAHLYIVNPFRGEQKASWFSKLFLTHPSTEERVKALLGMNLSDRNQ